MKETKKTYKTLPSEAPSEAHQTLEYVKELSHDYSWYNQILCKIFGEKTYLDRTQSDLKYYKFELEEMGWKVDDKKYNDKDIFERLVSVKNIFYESSCANISLVVGSGIHLYTFVLNNQNHFQNIYDDFTNERYILGTLKALVPYALPYAVSFYARKKAKRESQGKINELENIIQNIQTNRN